MVTITRFEGTEKKLYELVAPLVMDPAVLKQNKNYPFKTNKNFIWYLASNEYEILGFLPAEIRNSQAVLNNYYSKKEDQTILSQLIQKALNDLEEKYTMVAIVQVQHIETFKKHNFETLHIWKNYLKMVKKR